MLIMVYTYHWIQSKCCFFLSLSSAFITDAPYWQFSSYGSQTMVGFGSSVCISYYNELPT